MKLTTIFISLFLTWAAYDQNLFRRRRDQYDSQGIELCLSESELQEKKQIQKRSSGVIPEWQTRHRKPVRVRVNYFSTKPRDVRFSNQRKIRRMFNNM